VSVTVDNDLIPPTVAISAPAAGDVEFHEGGVLLGSDTWPCAHSAQGKAVLSVFVALTPGPVRLAVTLTWLAQLKGNRNGT